MKPACLDSSAWIEIAHNGPNTKKFLDAAREMERVVVSTITLYEVYKYTLVNADEVRAQQLADLLMQGRVVPPDASLAITAAKLGFRHKIAMADALIYATALAYKATLWTQDVDFKDLPNVNFLPKSKP